MATAKSVNPKALTPLPGYIFVEPVKVDKKTPSGIYLPDTHDEKPQQGLVLAVGDVWVTEHGAKISAPVKKGDHVIYKKWGGNDVKIGDTEYQFLKFEDVLAVI